MISRFIILGSGRSGTSVLSGVFHVSGFSSVRWNRLFESEPLLELNETVLSDGWDETLAEGFISYFQLLERERNGKWCIKDPRLSLTINRVYPLIPKPIKVIYSIRDPRNTVNHLFEIRTTKLGMSEAEAMSDAEDLWHERNISILRFIQKHPSLEYLMVDYDDLVDRRLDDVIDRFVGKRMNYEIIQPNKRRSPPVAVSNHLTELYDEMREMYRNNLGNVVLNTLSPSPCILETVHRKIRYMQYQVSKKLSQIGRR